MGKDSSFKKQDRRSGKDRRKFTFSLHIPERRSGKDRRRLEGIVEKSKTANSNYALKKDDSESSKKS